MHFICTSHGLNVAPKRLGIKWQIEDFTSDSKIKVGRWSYWNHSNHSSYSNNSNYCSYRINRAIFTIVTMVTRQDKTPTKRPSVTTTIELNKPENHGHGGG